MNLTKEIDAIPPNGEWWKRSSRDYFLLAAKKMKRVGMKNEDIIDILKNLYSAIADEYGE